ncbi:MAG TPA: YoaK family protein [Acidobacteriaceae bacterium]|nr:YoaK family protein [Acidobacteriaceae bacterium]
MPLRRMTARERTEAANWQLAALLAFNAGAVDVVGYLGLRQFTSHMSGIVATLAAEAGTKGYAILLLRPAAILASFIAGAAFCAVLVNWERRRDRESLFAVPVFLEAVLLAVIPTFAGVNHLFATLMLMGFCMGLQNAIITKISHKEIRTTHVTGMVTDVGIELGKLIYWNRSSGHVPVLAHRRRLVQLSTLVLLFFAGGILSALTFQRVGFLLLLPLAALLAAPTMLPIFSDLKAHRMVVRA